MKDYRITREESVYVIEEQIFSLFWGYFRWYRKLSFPYMSKNVDKETIVKPFFPLYPDWYAAHEAAEFAMDHKKRTYAKFILNPCYVIEWDDKATGLPLLDSHVYYVDDKRLHKIGRLSIQHGNFLKLTSILDDYYARTTKGTSQVSNPN